MENSAVLLPQRAAQTHAKRSRNGKIKVGAVNRSAVVLKILVSVLLFLTVYAFWSFDYKEIQLGEAIAATLHNMKTVFLEPKLSTDTIQNVLYQLLVTFCLGILSTIFGAVLAGIEVSAYDYKNGFRVHMLGYSIARPEVTECLVHPTLEARHANSLRQIEILNRHGYGIDADRLHRADGKYIYKQHIMDDLVQRGKAPEMFGTFYQTVFKHGGICDFDIRYPSPLEALRAIKDAGGLAVLAHSGQQQNFCIIPELAKQGLDGLELNHHANHAKDHTIIRRYAEEYGLFLTGGSDFHGRYEGVSVDVGDYLAEPGGVRAILEGVS